MKTQFTPIAMRCTQEQFDAIRPKLEKHGLKAKDLSHFSNMPYLINYRFKGINSITNYSAYNNWEEDLGIKHVYHNWDENVFLQACGIDLDTYSVSKDFILEAHESACSTWKAKIEAQFPKLFPKPKAGKWYKLNNHDHLKVFFTGEYGNDASYGFNMRGDFSSSIGAHIDDRFEEATKEEIESAFIEEAKKRGFVAGVKIKPVRDGNWTSQTLICTDQLIYNISVNALYVKDTKGYWQVLFEKGEWSSIEEQIPEMTVAEIEKALGHKVKIVK